jgi:hypothetical protein
VLEAFVEFDPAVMDLFGGGESLDALNTVGLSDDDLVAGTLWFGTHFALDRLVPALEEIEHGRNYRMTLGREAAPM